MQRSAFLSLALAPIVSTLRIVALGDSLALGIGASSPANGFIFRAFLDVRKRYALARIDDFAIGGSTAADVRRLQVERLGGVPADVVIVCDGANDVVQRVSAQAFGATYRKLVADVRDAVPPAAIVCCGVPDLGMSPLFTGSDHLTMQRLSRGHDAVVREVAQHAGASFVDLYAVSLHARNDVDRFLSEDRFHPSDVGYALFADALSPVLLRAIGTRRRA